MQKKACHLSGFCLCLLLLDVLDDAVYTEAGELQRREPARRELLRCRPHKYWIACYSIFDGSSSCSLSLESLWLGFRCVAYWICLPTDSGADLSDADLRGADFSLANLTKVKCSGSHITLVQFHQDSIQARLCTRLYSILFKMPDKYLILIQNVQPLLNQTFIFGPISFMLLSLFIFYETNPFMFSLSDWTICP